MDTSIVVRKEEIEKALKANPIPGKHMLEFLKSPTAFPMQIIEDHELREGEVEIHFQEGDLWLCLDGNPIFCYGGEAVDTYPLKRKDGSIDERHLFAKEILGGKEVTLQVGDWLWIPAGQPHSHTCAGTTRMALIKIPISNE